MLISMTKKKITAYVPETTYTAMMDYINTSYSGTSSYGAISNAVTTALDSCFMVNAIDNGVIIQTDEEIHYDLSNGNHPAHNKINSYRPRQEDEE